MTEPDNRVLTQLREMRAEVKSASDRSDARFDAIETRVSAIERRPDRIASNGMRMWNSFIGRRAMAERSMAGIETPLVMLEARVERLEASRA